MTKGKNKNFQKNKKNMIANEKNTDSHEFTDSQNKNSQLKQNKTSKLYYSFLVLLLLVALGFFVMKRYGNVFFVATVNGTTINRISFYNRLEKQFGKQVVDQMVSELLIEQAAKEKGIVIGEKEIDTKIKALEKQFKGKDGLDQVLSLQGMTRDDLQKQLKYNLIVEKITPKVKVSENEIADYFDKNQEMYPDGLTDDATKQIKDLLTQQKQNQVVSTWFEDLKKKAKITTNIK